MGACVLLDTSTSILVFVCGLGQLAQIHLHVAIDAFLSVRILIKVRVSMLLQVHIQLFYTVADYHAHAQSCYVHCTHVCMYILS